MQAGKLRHRVLLRQPGSGQDDIGQPITTFVDVATVWGDVRYASGTESIRADAIVATTKCSIQIRMRTDVDATWQAKKGDRDFKIHAVLPDPTDKRYLNLVCEVIS